MYGIYYDGLSTTGHSCSLHLDDEQKIQLHGHEFESIPLTVISISPRVGDAPRYIQFPNGDSFETSDHRGLETLSYALAKVTAEKRKKFNIHVLESNYKIVSLALILILGMVFGTLYYGIPMLSRYAANHVSITVNEIVEQEFLEFLDDHHFEPSKLSVKRQEELTTLFDELLPEDQRIKMNVGFRSSEEIGANAFALPYGTIILTDQLVELAEEEGEIAAVMLHEIGHVVHNHSIQHLLEAAGIFTLLGLMIGDTDSISQLITPLPIILVQSSYSRMSEWQADTYAIEHMEKAHISAASFASILRKLEDSHKPEIKVSVDAEQEQKAKTENSDSSIFDYFSTHPGTDARIDRLESL